MATVEQQRSDINAAKLQRNTAMVAYWCDAGRSGAGTGSRIGSLSIADLRLSLNATPPPYALTPCPGVWSACGLWGALCATAGLLLTFWLSFLGSTALVHSLPLSLFFPLAAGRPQRHWQALGQARWA